MAKMWEQPWTTEEMRANAEHWNLAGDAGLLKHLQQFSQNLIGRIHTTNSAMDDMFRTLNNVSTEINNVNNTFLSLANTQFVENRVYEDEEKDSPTANKEQVPQPKSKEATEAEMIQRVKKSLENGFAVMDTKFNAIEVSGSDSEEEGSPSSVIRTVLEPKNPYLHWPLPHLIGSTEFMGDDSVGLITAVEDVITPPLTTHSSTSDLNENLVQESGDSFVKQASDWLSETEDADMFGRDSSPEELDFGAPSSQQAKSAASFAEELSSKLGGVASPANVTKPGDLWNEPVKASAALNDSIISTKNSLPTSIPSLFGPSNDLFHDDDDDDIFTVKDKKKPEVSALFDENNSTSQQKESGSSHHHAEPTFLEPKLAINKVRSASTPNVDDTVGFTSPADISKIETSSKLFDDDDEDDDDLFTVSSHKRKQDIVQQQTFNTLSNISVASEPSSIPVENILNIPIVGSSSSGLFSFSDGSNVPFEPENVSANLNKTPAADSATKQATQGWLDDNASDSNSLFDEVGVNDSLFQPAHRTPAEPTIAVNKRPLSLFDNDLNEPVDPGIQTEKKMSKTNLFDDEDLFSQSSHEPKFDIFGSSQGKMGSDDNLFSVQPSTVSVPSDFLNSGSDETDDIFSASQIDSTINEDVEDLFSSSPSQKSQSSEPKMNPTTISKQNEDIFSAPQISSADTEEVQDLFSSFPIQKKLSNEPKINLPVTSSKQTADLFVDNDDTSGDLFGFNASALSKDDDISLFYGAPLQATEKEPNAQLKHIPEDQKMSSEPLKSNVETLYKKPKENEKEKQIGIFTKPIASTRKVMTNEPITSVVSEEEASTETKPWSKDKVIGKIKSPIGFIVDPLALLPGSKPPPREKSTANEQASSSGLSGDIQVFGTSSKVKDPTDAVRAAPPSSSSFDDSKVTPTLHSAVKERAKIQVKRRPQSRRARHEAIRSSALLEDVDFGATPPNEVPTPIVKDKSPEKSNVDIFQKLARSETVSSRASIQNDTEAKSALTAQDIASPSTDEEDLFGVPQIIYKDKGELENTLFGSATVLSPYDEKDLSTHTEVENSANSKSLFQPDAVKSKVENFPKTSSSVNSLMSGPFSSDENLFSSSTSDLQDSLFLGSGSSKTIPKKTSFAGAKGTTKSLFDDEDDDDIFSKPPKTPLQVATKSAHPPQTRANIPVVKSSLKKTEDPFNDPLTSLPQ